MIGTIIKKVFGDKATRDLKEVQPLVEKIKAEFPKLQSLSNDELRGKTAYFKERIAAKIADEQARIDQLRKEIEEDPKMLIAEREKRYEEIDKLEEKTLGPGPRDRSETEQRADRRRQGHLEQFLGRGRNADHMGHDPLRRAADRRCGPAQGQDRGDEHR